MNAVWVLVFVLHGSGAEDLAGVYSTEQACKTDAAALNAVEPSVKAGTYQCDRRDVETAPIGVLGSR